MRCSTYLFHCYSSPLKGDFMLFATRLVVSLVLLSTLLSSALAATRTQEDMAVNLGVSIEYVQTLEDQARRAQVEPVLLYMAHQQFNNQLLVAQKGPLLGTRPWMLLVEAIGVPQEQLRTFPKALQTVARRFPKFSRLDQTTSSRELFGLDLATTWRLLREISGRSS